MKRSIKSIILVLLLILVLVLSIFFYLNWNSDANIDDGKSNVLDNKDDMNIDNKGNNSIEGNVIDDGSSNSDNLSSNSSLGNSNSNSRDFNSDNKQNEGISPNTNLDTKGDSNYVPITSFTISVNTTTLAIVESVDVGVSISPGNATDKNMSYVSSDSKIAVISRTIFFTGVRVGEAYISVTVNNSQTRVIKITVVDRKSSVGTRGSSYNKSFEVEYSNPTSGGINSSNLNSATNESDSSSTSDNKPNVENKNKYYYRDGKLLKNTYVDYIYRQKWCYKREG